MVLFCLTDTIGQNIEPDYKFSKITLSTGEIVKAKNITLAEDKVSFSKSNSASGQKENISYQFSEIQDIQVATKTNILPGFLIGTGAGLITMVIVEKIVEKPKSETSTTSGPGYTTTTTTTETKKMAPGPKIVIVAGGSLLGTIVGASIKKGWKTVFPNNTSMINNVDLNFALDYYNGYKPGLTFTYKF